MYGYEAIPATSGAEALEIYAAATQPIALVLSDMSMPGMSGLELHKALRTQWPGVRTLILSGYPLHTSPADWGAESIVGWLQKPINSDELIATIQSVLAASS